MPLSSSSKESSLLLFFSTIITIVNYAAATVGMGVTFTEEEEEQQHQNLTTTAPSTFETATTTDNNESVIENNNNNGIDESDYHQLIKVAVVLAPRITGIILFTSSFFMFRIAWKRRSKLFHRLVLGMSFYLLIASICLIIGTAAIPANDEHTIGNFGTITTCTVQGFFLQVGSMTSISYYCFLSLYSCVGILNNFNQRKVEWIEKYIHIVVHICPIISAIYLVYKEAINNTSLGFCHIESSPVGCARQFANARPPFYDTDNDIDSDNDYTKKCERGPDGYEYILLLCWTLPLFLLLIGTTTTMIVLYCMVRCRQDQIHIRSKIVAYQSIIYLLALYLALIPVFSIEFMVLLHGRSGFMYNTQLLSLLLFKHIAASLFGFSSMLIYRYFSTERNKSTTIPIPLQKQQQQQRQQQQQEQQQISNKTTSQQPASEDPSTSNTATNDNIENEKEECNSTKSIYNSNEENKIYATSIGNIFSSHEFEVSSSSNDDNNNNNKKEGRNNNFPHRPPQPRKPSYSFNIFDGTNATGAHAEFVHDGDSDDEQIDNGITDHWAAVQDYV